MKRGVLVYISGPITANDGRTIEQNIADGVAVFAELIRLGIPAFCPHLNGAYPSLFDISHAEWIAYDCAILDRCTHLLLMSRWETSTGARQEWEYFINYHSTRSVVSSIDELCELVGVER